MSTDYSSFQQYLNYSFGEVPLITYGMVGIVCSVLATLTLLQPDEGSENEPQVPSSQPPTIYGGKNKTKRNRNKRKNK
jgi:hypothetical protein